MEAGDLQQQQRPRRRRIEDVQVVGNKEAVRKLFDEGLNAGDLSAVDRYVASDVIGYDTALPAPNRGIEAFRANFKRYRDAFSDLQVRIEELVGENDSVVVRWRASGTHTGPFMGIPPTGRAGHDVVGVTIYRLANGRVIESHNTWDTLGLMMQIGLAPGAQAMSTAAGDERDARATLAALGDAFNRSDAKAFASYFAEDATLIDPMGNFAAGRAEVEKRVQQNLDTFLKGTETRFELTHLRSLAPGLAFADFEHHLSGLEGKQGPEGTRKLHVVGLGKRSEGRWVWLDARPHTYLQP